MLKLSFGLEFADLHQREGLTRLDAQFLQFVAASDPEDEYREMLLKAQPLLDALGATVAPGGVPSATTAVADGAVASTIP